MKWDFVLDLSTLFKLIKIPVIVPPNANKYVINAPALKYLTSVSIEMATEVFSGWAPNNTAKQDPDITIKVPSIIVAFSCSFKINLEFTGL